MGDTLKLIEVLSQVATVAGIGIAIIVFLSQKRKERVEREFSAYHSLDEKYIEYLLLCIQHPELDVYFIPLMEQRELTAQQRIQQCAILEILICLLERAFLFYRDQPSPIRLAQWKGWEGYIEDWCKQETFKTLWRTLGSQFDQRFIDYVDDVIRRATSETLTVRTGDAAYRRKS
jgi:hypothetical protein